MTLCSYSWTWTSAWIDSVSPQACWSSHKDRPLGWNSGQVDFFAPSWTGSPDDSSSLSLVWNSSLGWIPMVLLGCSLGILGDSKLPCSSSPWKNPLGLCITLARVLHYRCSIPLFAWLKSEKDLPLVVVEGEKDKSNESCDEVSTTNTKTKSQLA